MSQISYRMQLPKMRAAYITAFENLLSVKPDLELTQKAALDKEFMQRFFAHIELYGVERVDLTSIHMKITAAQLGITNTYGGWEQFLAAKQSGALL